MFEFFNMFLKIVSAHSEWTSEIIFKYSVIID